MSNPREPVIIPPIQPKILLQVTVNESNQLSLGSLIKDKKILINLLIDLIKMVNNQEETLIQVPK